MIMDEGERQRVRRLKGGGDPTQPREPTVAEVVAATLRSGQRHPQPENGSSPFDAPPQRTSGRVLLDHEDHDTETDPAKLAARIPRRP